LRGWKKKKKSYMVSIDGFMDMHVTIGTDTVSMDRFVDVCVTWIQIWQVSMDGFVNMHVTRVQ
jgi:hypothetical protein